MVEEYIAMPLDKFVLMLAIVVAAAGATIWLGVLLAAAFQFTAAGFFVLLPVAAIAYVIWRVIADRIGNREDDHYDRIEK